MIAAILAGCLTLAAIVWQMGQDNPGRVPMR